MNRYFELDFTKITSIQKLAKVQDSFEFVDSTWDIQLQAMVRRQIVAGFEIKLTQWVFSLSDGRVEEDS